MKTHSKSLFVLVALSIMTMAIGCGDSTDKGEDKGSNGSSSNGHSDEGHSHGEGPNGGAVADWGGGKYHVEFTVDHDAKQATVYILGGDAKTAEPVAAEKLLLSIGDPEFQTDLMPQPLEGEAEGTSSRFVGTHDSLGIVQEFSGTISGEVDGTPFAGKFAEEP